MTDDMSAALAEGIKLSAHLFARRLLTLIGMVLDFALFAWVCAYPDWVRFGAAVAFGVAVFAFTYKRAET